MDEMRISEYLHSLEPDGSGFMESLRAFAKENDVPIVRRETESFLRTMCVLKKPETILEIGTAIAYSTTVFAEYCDRVVTLENYEKRITLAKENIRALGNEDRITLISGDAGESLKELSAEGRKFDMIFLDDVPCDGSLLTNTRQADACARAGKALETALDSMNAGITPDAVLVDVEAAMEALGELTGRIMREDITNRIFERFCVGK